MSRRGQSGFTGANAIPLGTRNKAIGSKRSFTSSPPRDDSKSSGDSASNSAVKAFKAAQAAAASLSKLAHLGTSNPGSDSKEMWSAPSTKPSYQSGGNQQNLSNKDSGGGNVPKEERGRKRAKKSRWGSMIRTEIPGMPAAIPTHLTPEQQKAYIIQLQIEDISRKLKSGDLGIPINPDDRSPSPEPIYNGEGKRMNTREYRTRKRLEEDRHKLIQQMMELNTEYKPPMDYKPAMQRVSERVMIPQDINPNINFVGLLIGPRGNTLKKIEKESNCKIMIRGKGSVKEGKIGRKDGQPLPGEDEPLHALVSSSCLENVQKAVNQINTIIKQGIEQPEEENDLRKLQLMELAKLNGTLREDLMPKERAWLKPENQNITNTTICTKCGGRGHLAQDCIAPPPGSSLQPGMRPPGDMGPGGNVDRAKMDSEYMSLMAELGEGPPSGDGGPGPGPNTGPGRFNNGPPQRRFGGGRNNAGGMGGPGGGGPRWDGPQGGGGGRFNNGPPDQQQQQGRPRFGDRDGGRRREINNSNRPPPPSNNNQGGPPPPWMGQAPFPPPSGGPNQWGPPQGGMEPPFGGGFPAGPPPTDGNMGGPWMGQGGGNMMGGDQNSGGGFFNQPPPPPPSSAPQPPLPPSSGSGGGKWGQGWGGQNDGTNNMGGTNMNPTSGSNSYNDPNFTASYGGMPQGMDGSMGGYAPMGGFGNMGMWGMNTGAVPPPPGPVPPPMPSGPGPVPPPPPSGQGTGDGDYNSIGGMGMMQGYGMPPAPPPPPPQ